MDFSHLRLISSNDDKLREFRSFGLKGLRIEKGIDLREVDSDPKTVVLYKALDAGANTIVEDTSLFVEGTSIGVNIRWNIDNLAQYLGHKALFVVYLAVNENGRVIIYRGSVRGRITQPATVVEGREPMGFDNYFTPVGSDLNLYQLDLEGKKSFHSARMRAVHSLLEDIPVELFNKTDVPEWHGKYQC